MRDVVQYGDSIINLDNYEVKGAISYSLGFSNPVVPINYLGGGFLKTENNGAAVGAVAVTRYAFFDDPFLDYVTGVKGIRGSFTTENSSFKFTSGFANSYSAEGRVGDFPKTNVSFNIYGDITTGSYPVGRTHAVPQIVTPQSIEIVCSGSSTNNVKAYNYNVTMPLSPVYSFGATGVQDVNINNSIEVTMGFTLDVDDYQTRGMYNMLKSRQLENLQINLKNNAGDLVTSYTINSGELISESYQQDVGDNFSVNLEYLGYL